MNRRSICFRGVWVGVATLALGLAGCAGGERTYPVKGQLVYEDDQPIKELAGFSITFSSESLGKSVTGQIKADGSFQMSALPGDYKVGVTQPRIEPERSQFRKPVVDQAYENPATSTLDAQVEAKDNTVSFKLKRYTGS